MRAAYSAEDNQPHAGSRSKQRRTIQPCRAAREQKMVRAHSENHRHRAHHQAGMGDVGQLQPPELHKKLHRNAKERGQQQGAPLRPAQPRRVYAPDFAKESAAAPGRQTETGKAPYDRRPSRAAQSCRSRSRCSTRHPAAAQAAKPSAVRSRGVDVGTISPMSHTPTIQFVIVSGAKSLS